MPAREFQIFVKPVGPVCNLDCSYCYYLEKEQLFPANESFRMPGNILEEYIVRHIQASTEPVIGFSWHGGEPTMAGLEFFRNAVALQRKYRPPGRRIVNGIQTNGTLLNDEWCRFFADENFLVGISIDGPPELHNIHRLSKGRKPTFQKALRGYELLQKYKVTNEILCVVNADNVKYPLEVYRFFKGLEARYISFLPLVEPLPGPSGEVSRDTVPAEAFGKFLAAVFDEWVDRDIGRVKVQIFEEAARTAFNQDHTLCIFKQTCGAVPVVEHNGDFYSCDHFVDARHCLGNIRDRLLADLLDSPEQKAFGQAKLDTLPGYCLDCDVRSMCNGECPKNRFIRTPDGEPGLNYLCPGYKYFFTHCRPFVNAIAAEWRQQIRERGS